MKKGEIQRSVSNRLRWLVGVSLASLMLSTPAWSYGFKGDTVSMQSREAAIARSLTPKGVQALLELDMADMYAALDGLPEYKKDPRGNLWQVLSSCKKLGDEKRRSSNEAIFERELRQTSAKFDKLRRDAGDLDNTGEFDPTDRSLTPLLLREEYDYWQWLTQEANKQCPGLVRAYWDHYIYPPYDRRLNDMKEFPAERPKLLHRKK